MALAIAASLVGTNTPKAVQIVVTGLTDGDDYEVTGSWSGGSWDVRAGTGTVDGTQVVLVDIASPINVPITYTAVTDSGTVEADAVTVAYDGDDDQYLLQSLDGGTTVAFRWLDNAAPRAKVLRGNVFRIPGRATPVIVYDVPGGTQGELVARTTATHSQNMLDLLALGGMALLRTNGSVRDLPAVEFLFITRAESALSGVGNDRAWTLSYEVVDDPEPDTAVAASDWDDFDTVYVDLTWDDFDDEWTDQTWDDFDVEDWASRAATS